VDRPTRHWCDIVHRQNNAQLFSDILIASSLLTRGFSLTAHRWRTPGRSFRTLPADRCNTCPLHEGSAVRTSDDLVIINSLLRVGLREDMSNGALPFYGSTNPNKFPNLQYDLSCRARRFFDWSSHCHTACDDDVTVSGWFPTYGSHKSIYSQILLKRLFDELPWTPRVSGIPSIFVVVVQLFREMEEVRALPINRTVQFHQRCRTDTPHNE